MNTRIKEIAVSIGVKPFYSYDYDGGKYVFYEDDLKKFANTIIEDFLAIAENELHPQAYAQVLTKVQQHFYETTQI